MYRFLLNISTFAYAFYIYSFPISFYNDDALFLSNGILNFSVIDFSPHFPGYVSLIYLGKLINLFLNDSKLSLFIISTSCAIFLPLVIFLYVEKISNRQVALVSFLFIISSSYLVNLSLSLLSDSMGLLFLFLSLYLIELNKNKTSGILLSIAIFARPSYFIFYFVGLIYLFFLKKDQLKSIFISFLSMSFLFFILIYVTNGDLYFYEAKRFISGHFNIWGNGQFTEISWFNNIFNINNLSLILLFFCFRLKKEFYLLYLLSFFYLLWILYGQNPDNIRHIIPLVFIIFIFIADRFSKSIVIIGSVLVLNLLVHFNYQSKYSPIDQISFKLDNKKDIIIINRNIEILREKDFIVLDKYYKSSAEYLKNEKKIILISSNKNEFINYKIIKGRFIGERTLYINAD